MRLDLGVVVRRLDVRSTAGDHPRRHDTGMIGHLEVGLIATEEGDRALHYRKEGKSYREMICSGVSQ